MEKLKCFTLENSNGCRVNILNFGGTIQKLVVPDKNGKPTDVALGFDDESGYDVNTYFGALIGRCGNRIANGVFSLNGKTYKLYVNNGENHLHGGKSGFDKKYWQCGKVVKNKDGQSLTLTILSPDGEEGYPGNLSVTVTYTLTNDNRLIIDYYAKSDKDTVCNLTNHCYFNLSGHDSGNIYDNIMQIEADYMTAVNSGLIPTGENLDLALPENACLDFRKPKKIGEGIGADHKQIKYGGGYDFNYVLRGKGFKKAATAYSPVTGIKMETFTELPGVQFYSGNFMSKTAAKDGTTYDYRGGFCLETQCPPDAINHPEFPSVVLKAGAEYKTRTVYAFSIKS